MLRSLRNRVIAGMTVLIILVFAIAMLGVNSIDSLDRSVDREQHTKRTKYNTTTPPEHDDCLECVNVIDYTTGQPFPGNIIPTGRLDPTTQLATQYTVTPNVTVPAGAATFPGFNSIATPLTVNNYDQYNVRLDHHVGPRDQLFGTFSVLRRDARRQGAAPVRRRRVPALEPAGHHHARAHVHAEPAERVPLRLQPQQDLPARGDLLRAGLRARSVQPGEHHRPGDHVRHPRVQHDRVRRRSARSRRRSARSTRTCSSPTTSACVKGLHNVRAGFQISKQDYFQITNFSGNPSFTFDGRYSGLQANGIGLADFLLGVPSRAGGAIGDSIQNLSTTYWAGYVQDDWRIVPNLTAQLRAALRVRALAGRTRRQEPRLRARTGADPAGRAGRPPRHRRSGLEQLRARGWASRGGRRCSRTSSCAAAPASTTRPTISTRSSSRAPARRSSRRRRSKAIRGTPNLFMRDMMPSFTNSPNVNPFTFDRVNRTPYLTQWSFGAQKSLWKDYLLEVEYTGSRGSKLPQRRNLNIGRIDPTGTIPIVQRVPYPQYGFILMTYNGGWSSYNALTTKLEKRFSKGLYFLGSYTWQKSLDLGATDEFSALSAEFKKYDKGHSTFDVPHRFVGTWVYELPVGRGRALMADMPAALDAVLGGWQVSGIATFSQGQFQTPTLGTDWLLLGSFTTSRPERHRRSDGRPSAPRRLSESRRLRRFPRRRAGQPDSRAGQRRAEQHSAARASTTGTSASSRTSASAIGSTRSSAGRRSTRGTTRSSVPRT